MHRYLPVIFALMVACRGRAQEPSPAAASDDLHTLRQLVEQQSKQLEMLTQQVARLTQLIESSHLSAAATPAAAQNMPPQETSIAPAEAVTTLDGSTQHVVTKGETLTSVAKHYKISVAELLKVNKIDDERKLQIGQTLTIPAPKPAESSKQNKL